MIPLEKNFTGFFKHRVVLHVGFWLAFFISSLMSEWHDGNFPLSLDSAFHMIVPFMGFVCISYINIYLLIPRYFITRKYPTYIFLNLLNIALCTFFFQVVQYLVHLIFIGGPYNENVIFLFYHLSFNSIFLMLISSLFYFMRRWMHLKEVEIRLQETEKQKVMSELKTLKAQINPHFLFNSLNNIYSLSLEKNPITPKIVLKLSDLLNYVLYESSIEKISLRKEIAFVKNYIDLEKSRFEDSIDIALKIEEANVENFQIAPLLFIPFVENAFKHCGGGENDVPKIKIWFLTSNLPKIILHVENTKEPNKPINTKRRGVGLENVKQRLELIYPGKYKLEIKEDDCLFSIKLEIEL